MIRRIASYLEDRSRKDPSFDGATSLEIIHDVLGMNVTDPSVAERTVAASLANDRRFSRDSDSKWHYTHPLSTATVPQKTDTQLSDATFATVECTAIADGPRRRPVEVVAVLFDTGGHREILHRRIQPTGTPGSETPWSQEQLAELTQDDELTEHERPLSQVLDEYRQFVGLFPRISLKPSTLPSDFQHIAPKEDEDATAIDIGSQDTRTLRINLSRIARRLTGRKSRLGELASSAGLPPPGPRALDRARATADIFLHLLPSLEKNGVTTIEKLLEYQASREHTMEFDGLAFGRERIDSLPRTPGVYRMLDRSARVLYVGKAKDLHRRVGSYFLNRDELPEKLERMLDKLFDMDYEQCGSELAALLREAELIEMFHPPINRQMTTRPGEPIRSVPENFVIILPAITPSAATEAPVELFAVAEGRPLARREVRPDKLGKTTLVNFLRKHFRRETCELTDRQQRDVDIVRRWLARELDTAILLDVDAAGSLAHAARLLGQYIADAAAGTDEKTLRI